VQRYAQGGWGRTATPCFSWRSLPVLTRFYSPDIEGEPMNQIIYIVGLVVVIGAVLTFLGLR
jgi:hypothetical protein